MRNAALDRLWLELPGRLRRIVKQVVQGTLLRRSWTQKYVYIVGCQRSGTTMLLRMFDFSMLTRVFDEAHDNEAFLKYRLRSPSELEVLASEINAPVIVFKPLCESHRVDQFLDCREKATAVWIYRHYTDVANSSVRKWGGHWLDTVKKICTGRLQEVGWRGERIGTETLAQVRSLYSSDLTHREGASLFWYIRNRIVEELGLSKNPRARIVRYSRLVSEPCKGFQDIFEFIGIPYASSWSNWVYSSSVAKDKRPELRGEIEAVCQSLMERLDQMAIKSRMALDEHSDR